jgi:hypothetical protein
VRIEPFDVAPHKKSIAEPEIIAKKSPLHGFLIKSTRKWGGGD